jgi:hypothetical protein
MPATRGFLMSQCAETLPMAAFVHVARGIPKAAGKRTSWERE